MRPTLSLFAAALLAVGAAAPAVAQDAPADPWAGSWRGTAALLDGETATVILTVMRQGDGYAGFVSGFETGREIRLTSVRVEGDRLIAEGATDTELGELAVRYDLVADGNTMTGTQRYGFGLQSVEFDVELNRRRRRDVPQPQVQQRLGYFVGEWELDYTGGEFPPLSIGTRSARIVFTQQGDAPFVTGAVTGDVWGEAYEETIVIGWDAQANMLVLKETLSTGVELLSVGNWQSPIAITLVTSPVQAEGRTYQRKRIISVTSETAFAVADEFSVDGGPYRRMGSGVHARVE